MDGTPPIFISAKQFEKLFPFHFIVGEHLLIQSAGMSLLKVYPHLIGESFQSVFMVKRPSNIMMENATIKDCLDQIFILKVEGEVELLLRGHFINTDVETCYMFVGSPWITDLNDLRKSNLLISDFALHDTITDMMLIIQSKELVMKDLHVLMERLQSKGEVLLRSEREVKSSNSKLNALIQNMQSGILVEDSQRKVLLCNQALCDFFEMPVSAEALLGSDCSSAAEQIKEALLHPDEFVDRIAVLIRENKTVIQDLLFFKNGKILERDFIPVMTADNELNYLWHYNDVTVKKRIEIDLVNAKNTAVKSQKIKEDFLANMSHEIRTPLNAILGFSNLLQKTKLNEEQKDLIDTVAIAGDNLMGIINDILDFTKMESGNIILENAALDLKLTLLNSSKILSKKIEEKNIDFKVCFDNSLPRWVLGDALRLSQIATNLLGNALKFTSNDGKVTLNVFGENIDEFTNNVSIEISDTGIGISADKMETIFDRFTQAEDFTSRKFGGTGLGLSITKMLVEQFGGTISCRSRYGEGSVFTVRIPFVVASEMAVGGVLPKESKFKKEIQMLLVEDNVLNQKLAKKVIPAEWGQIDVAENGLVAKELLKTKSYDIILMDLQMPLMNGYETTHYVRHVLHSEIPIIAMTANAILGEREKCIAAGMNDYVSKPFRADDLLSRMKLLFPPDHFTDVIKPESPSAVAKEALFNLEHLNEIAEGDESFVGDFLKTFVAEMQKEIPILSAAIANGNSEDIMRIAHKSKVSFVVLNAVQIETLCKEIEQNPDSDGVVRSGELLLQLLQELLLDVSKIG